MRLVVLAIVATIVVACRAVPAGQPTADPAPAVSTGPETTYHDSLASRDSCRGRRPDLVRDETEVDVPPRPIRSGFAPHFPSDLRHSGVQGDVVVCFVVSATGQMETEPFVIAASPHPDLTRSVRAFLESARFEPAQLRGGPVRSWTQQAFLFRLAK